MRGKGKKPAMVKVNLRIPVEVLEFYKNAYEEYTGGMRDILSRFAEADENILDWTEEMRP